MAPYQLPLRLALKNVAVRLPRNTCVFQSFHNTGIIIHYYHFKRQTRWAAPVLTQRKGGRVVSLTQICSAARKKAAPIRLQHSSGHLVKHVAKPQAKKWAAKKWKIESKRVSYKPLKSLDIFVWSRHMSKSFWTLSEDEMCLLFFLQALAKVYATHVYRQHLMPLMQRILVACTSNTWALCYHHLPWWRQKTLGRTTLISRVERNTGRLCHLHSPQLQVLCSWKPWTCQTLTHIAASGTLCIRLRS